MFPTPDLSNAFQNDHDVRLPRVESQAIIENMCGEFQKNNYINPAYFQKWDVKRGLRNADGTGVMAGVTRIGSVRGYYVQDGEKIPAPGQLLYRGYDINDLIMGFTGAHRFGFEETAYLLLFGALPTREQLDQFKTLLAQFISLPPLFTEDMIIKAPSKDIMNKLARSVLALYSYAPDPEDMSLTNELLQAIQLIARCPTIVAHSYAVKRHYFDNDSLYLHRPQTNLSVAENFLYALRQDKRYTEDEARLLDLCLVLHMEHGGGNNSAFACRVLSSSGTDIYSAIAGAIGSLKGPRHGGANRKVVEMFQAIQQGVRDWSDEDEVSAFLKRILNREAGDGSGLIYGMGHAIYTLSDPRSVLLKKFAKKLAVKKGMEKEFNLVETVEKLTPAVFAVERGLDKPLCSNVDLYSGMVYQMMDIPMDLYTPLFAIARIVGWCAHRIEELFTPGGKIIRPAYKSVVPLGKYIPIEQRS